MRIIKWFFMFFSFLLIKTASVNQTSHTNGKIIKNLQVELKMSIYDEKFNYGKIKFVLEMPTELGKELDLLISACNQCLELLESKKGEKSSEIDEKNPQPEKEFEDKNVEEGNNASELKSEKRGQKDEEKTKFFQKGANISPSESTTVNCEKSTIKLDFETKSNLQFDKGKYSGYNCCLSGFDTITSDSSANSGDKIDSETHLCNQNEEIVNENVQTGEKMIKKLQTAAEELENPKNFEPNQNYEENKPQTPDFTPEEQISGIDSSLSEKELTDSTDNIVVFTSLVHDFSDSSDSDDSCLDNVKNRRNVRLETEDEDHFLTQLRLNMDDIVSSDASEASIEFDLSIFENGSESDENKDE